MASNKLTIDLLGRNKEVLEKIKNERKVPYGNTINSLISTFCEIPEVVKKELLFFAETRIKELYKEMDAAGECLFKELDEQSQSYLKIATFLNDGKKISVEKLKEEPVLKKYPIKNGILICPNNWIIVNPEKADAMMYAGVVECRNAEKFGKENFGVKIPHFLFFSEKKYAREYDAYFLKYINEMCVRAWPNFQKVIDSQIEAIDDPERPGYQINADEWMKAPIIGHFAVYEQGDKAYGSNYKPPFGARIVRLNSCESSLE